jgi:hypothetical protein
MDDNQGTNTPEGSEGNLTEQFESWKQDSIPLPGMEKKEESLEERVQTAGRVLAVRRISFGLILALALVGVSNSYSDLTYFLQSSDPVELGDLRQAYNNDEVPEGLSHNNYIRAERMITTSVFDSPKYSFFFCPLYKIVVRTEQRIPEKPMHRSYFEVAEGDARILSEKLAFVWDLQLDFTGEGRLLSVDSLPSRYQSLWKTFRNELGEEADGEVFILLDGESPNQYLWFLLAYLASFGLVAFSGRGFWIARRRYAELKREVGLP